MKRQKAILRFRADSSGIDGVVEPQCADEIARIEFQDLNPEIAFFTRRDPASDFQDTAFEIHVDILRADSRKLDFNLKLSGGFDHIGPGTVLACAPARRPGRGSVRHGFSSLTS